ncbi:hypothetical protein PAHAL_4G293900 [Panicum hallii]|jgi:hypothetical protein|uniref:Uncharacterized protein n=1 Tax=Panicum hallii TaxID=206008 RepID=A0A2T8JED8_9POAL|nr:uncharacterized protein LOC112890055 [Panicum hallii]PVH48268.1 hypothetical protein PAHAL_4G293900 [Panicum hallii]
MDLLEHPFEAVAFRLYSLPEASAATGAAAWTCLAAVLAAAAAAGLWRLRASAPTAVATAAAKPLGLDPCPKEEAPTAPLTASERWSEPPAAPSPKERYTAYYRDTCRVGCCDEDGGDDDDDREDDAEEHDDDDCGVGAYRTPSETTNSDPFGWEEPVVRSLPLSPTAAEVGLGPGRYRSPRALGGSVVQLWDQVVGGGLLTPTASPRRRGRVVATAPGF